MTFHFGPIKINTINIFLKIKLFGIAKLIEQKWPLQADTGKPVKGQTAMGMAPLNDNAALAIDGGGIKGLFSAAVLAKWEEDLHCSLIEHFDLITGTSTGGIIALGLGLGLRPRGIRRRVIRKDALEGFDQIEHADLESGLFA